MSFFLAAKEIVEDFMDQFGGIHLQDKFIPARRHNSSKRIIFSNVSPIIPNDALLDCIKNFLKLNPCSPLTILRAKPKKEGCEHIISWRRQIYCKINDNELKQLPGSFLMNCQDTSYRIFITLDEMSCFKCHQRGHKAEDCKAEDSPLGSFDSALSDPIDFPLQDETTMEIDLNVIPTSSIPQDINIAPPTTNKRPLSDTSSVTTDNTNTSPNQQTNPRKKKNHSYSHNPPSTNLPSNNEESGTSCSEEETDTSQQEKDTETLQQERETNSLEQENQPKTIKEIFAPLKENFTTKNYPIKSLDNFSLMVDMCHKDANIIDVVSSFTSNFKGMIKILEDNYSLVNRSTKIRFTKIINKLKEVPLPLLPKN